METRLKLEDLTYQQLLNLVPNNKLYMQEKPADEFVEIWNEYSFDRVKSKVIDKWGNITIVINPDLDWSRVIKYEDDKFEQAYLEYEQRKADWLEKYDY